MRFWGGCTPAAGEILVPDAQCHGGLSPPPPFPPPSPRCAAQLGAGREDVDVVRDMPVPEITDARRLREGVGLRLVWNVASRKAIQCCGKRRTLVHVLLGRLQWVSKGV